MIFGIKEKSKFWPKQCICYKYTPATLDWFVVQGHICIYVCVCVCMYVLFIYLFIRDVHLMT